MFKGFKEFIPAATWWRWLSPLSWVLLSPLLSTSLVTSVIQPSHRRYLQYAGYGARLERHSQ